METRPNLKPMPLQTSLILFLVPGFLVLLNVYFVMGIFNNMGLTFFYNYNIIYGILSLSLLLLLSIYLYKREGNDMNFNAFKERFRLKRVGWKDLLWAIGLFIVMLLGVLIFNFTAKPIAELINPPSYWPPSLNPLTETSSTAIPTTIMGEKLAGNWLVFIFILINLILVSFAEEFMWSVYILPRQELKYGDKAWIVHGVLWTSFHMAFPWTLIELLPGALALSYVVQRKKNTSIGMIAHFLVDAFPTLLIVLIAILR